MPATSNAELAPLYQLAPLYGVQRSYHALNGERCVASPEALLAVLQALGALLQRVQDAAAARPARREELWRQPVPPAVVLWDDAPPVARVRLPASVDAIGCILEQETGETASWKVTVEALERATATEVNGVRYLSGVVSLPSELPHGYHHLTLEVGGSHSETLVLRAPVRAFQPAPEHPQWGSFLPLYALRTPGRLPSYGDLARLGRWTAANGGSMVGTLPLLPTFLDEPLDPSPYSPISRRFWSELYIDPERVGELAHCPEAQALLASVEYRSRLHADADDDYVDYKNRMRLQTQVLRLLSACFFSSAEQGSVPYQRFLASHPEVVGYARFRAAGERYRTPWQQWPARQQQGNLGPDDVRPEDEQYWCYAQWQAHQQLSAAAAEAQEHDAGLYLDFPLGVHPSGYDVWRKRSSFVQDVAAGAPPDSFFLKGQDWGFPPLHPAGLARDGFGAFIAPVRHHLQHARMLRIDHIMGLHRLFWVPRGTDPKQGVYVRYPAEALTAVLVLESHRHHAAIVGENLGTVPPQVVRSMERHGLMPMYVAQYQLSEDAGAPLGPMPANALASLNTHDMPAFSGFWHERDNQDRLDLGLLSDADYTQEQARRQRQKAALVSLLLRQGVLDPDKTEAEDAILLGLLEILAASPSPLLLLNLEDLWLEDQAQNVPGTVDERPNWRRKARYTLEEMERMPAITEMLRKITEVRSRVGVAARG